LKLLTPRAYLRHVQDSPKRRPAKKQTTKRKPTRRKPGAKGLGTLSQVEISRAERRVPEAVSRMRADAEEILRLVLHRLDDMKAEDTLTINLRDRSSIGDYMVVSSGRSQRHVGSVADRIIEDLRKVGVHARVEGMPHCDWVLIDAGDVIVHVFRPEVRDFYNLEKMWMVGRSARRAS
jgi:ribosome-associated protein